VETIYIRFFTTLSAGIRCKWPNQFNLCGFDLSCGYLATDSSTNTYCYPLVDSLPVLRQFLMLPLAVFMLLLQKSVLHWRFGRTVPGNRRTPGFLVQAPTTVHCSVVIISRINEPFKAYWSRDAPPTV
jgi:hypothetical protein